MRIFLYILLSAFIASKIFGIITWSWWIVLIPAYILILIYIIVIVIAVLAAIFSDKY